MKKSGRFTGVGIGPGDPGLLTLKAKKTLERADIIFVPKGADDGTSCARTIIAPVIGRKKQIVELTFPMTRNKILLKKYWRRAARRIMREIMAGKDTAFVTLGDPFIYSTYIYLLKTLRQEFPAADVETIPGISAFNAAAARADFPLLEGSQKMAVLPVRKDLKGIEEALKNFDTVVLMKVGGKLQKVIALLTKTGFQKNAVLVSRLGHPEEKIIKDIASIKDKHLGYLSVILVKKGNPYEE